MLDEISKSQHVVGTKQTLKAVEQNNALKVFLAKDTDEAIREKIVKICKKNHVAIEEVDRKEELGKACNISLDAAVACILKNEEGGIRFNANS